MTTAHSELDNRREAIQARVAALKQALDERDYDAAYSHAGAVSALAAMLVAAAERVLAQEARRDAAA